MLFSSQDSGIKFLSYFNNIQQLSQGEICRWGKQTGCRFHQRSTVGEGETM